MKIIDFGLSEEIKNDEIHGGRKGWELKKGHIWSVGIVSYTKSNYSCNT